MPKAKKTSRKPPAQPSLDKKLRDIAGLFLSEPAIDTLLATHAEWATPMGFGLDKLMDLDVFDMRNLRRVLHNATLVPLPPHSQDARKAAQLGMQADAMAIHRRQNAARHARLSGRDVAKALGAEPAGKAPKRAAAHSPRTAAQSRTRKAR